MTKGAQIKQYISEGLSNEAILALVNTTMNSIRWYRSKMAKNVVKTEKKASNVRVFPAPVRTGRMTMGEAMDKYGFADEILECCKRIIKDVKNDNSQQLYNNLRNWSFVLNGKANGRFGCCKYRQRVIEVHPCLLDHMDDFRQTFLHECAHQLDVAVNGYSSHHGYNWKFIMSVGFRLSSQRCGGHTEAAEKAIESSKKSVETWVCEKCGHEHGIARKRKYPASSYTHSGCGGKFQVKA